MDRFWASPRKRLLCVILLFHLKSWRNWLSEMCGSEAIIAFLECLAISCVTCFSWLHTLSLALQILNLQSIVEVWNDPALAACVLWRWIQSSWENLRFIHWSAEAEGTHEGTWRTRRRLAELRRLKTTGWRRLRMLEIFLHELFLWVIGIEQLSEKVIWGVGLFPQIRVAFLIILQINKSFLLFFLFWHLQLLHGRQVESSWLSKHVLYTSYHRVILSNVLGSARCWNLG